MLFRVWLQCIALSWVLPLSVGFQAPNTFIHQTSRLCSPINLSTQTRPLLAQSDGVSDPEPQEVASETISDEIPEPAYFNTLDKIFSVFVNPVTTLAYMTFRLAKNNKLITNPFFVGGYLYCVKWYRARYVFNIALLDRQPSWDNIVRSKDEEEQLRAYTCKTCGATLFIAKSREFFFEGRTGLGGMGCYSCGTKGADNFVMDRDRILEDVKDLEDNYEYEMPLDYASPFERRALLKKAGGDREKANQMLIDKETLPVFEEEGSPSTYVGEFETEESPDLSSDEKGDTSETEESPDLPSDEKDDTSETEESPDLPSDEKDDTPNEPSEDAEEPSGEDLKDKN